jgi:alkylhydroperoxidase/carboxymuconolactone decarboxylase family protein YurZ
MKTKESRFQVHDELTAPERSLPVLKGALAAGGQLSNFIGVLAGSPAGLRAYARFRSELRHGTLPLKTQQRIGLGLAQHQGNEYAQQLLARTAREAGWSDEQILEAVAHVSLASFTNLITRAGNVPADGSSEDARLLHAA